MTNEKLAAMTQEQYERYLKRNGMTGWAAIAMDQKRKIAIASLATTERAK